MEAGPGTVQQELSRVTGQDPLEGCLERAYAIVEGAREGWAGLICIRVGIVGSCEAL